MALSDKEQAILQEIVDLEGKCLSAVRCAICPFRALCLPEFLNPNPPSQGQRARLAHDVLVHNALVDDSISKENMKDHYSLAGARNDK